MADATTQSTTLVSTALRRNAAAMKRALPKAADGDVRAVHRARVATRRLREALPAAGAGSGLQRDVRKLTRVLGPVREMDVCRALIRDLAAERAWPQRLVNRLDAACVEQREQGARRLRSTLHRLDAAHVAQDIGDVADSLTGPSAVRTLAVTLHARLVRRVRELKHAIADAGSVYAPEKLHVVRKAAKKLRYVVEMSPAAVRRAAGGLRSVQEELGTLHDLQMVQRRLQELATDGHDAWCLRVASGLDRDMEARCREIHGTMLGRFPALVRKLDRLQTITPGMRPRAARARTAGRVLHFDRTA